MPGEDKARGKKKGSSVDEDPNKTANVVSSSVSSPFKRPRLTDKPLGAGTPWFFVQIFVVLRVAEFAARLARLALGPLVSIPAFSVLVVLVLLLWF
jgi:hypothetical protein